jgi:hypothetical protein
VDVILGRAMWNTPQRRHMTSTVMCGLSAVGPAARSVADFLCHTLRREIIHVVIVRGAGGSEQQEP